MRRAIVLIALGCAVPGLAHAELRTIGSRGLWSAFEGSGPDQRQVCGISTGGPDGRQISVMQYAGDTGLVVTFDKAGWAIPDGTPIPVKVAIDGAPQAEFDGRGSGRQVSAAMAFAPSIGFMRALRHGTQIRVDFPSGNEPFWSGGLSGTGAAIDAFNGCRGRFASAPTQPFAAAPAAPAGVATQPFTPAPVAPPSAEPQPAAPQATVPQATAPQGATPLPPIPPAPKP